MVPAEGGALRRHQIPRDRWCHSRFGHPRRSEPGKAYTWAAGVLSDIWSFDPGAFGISPREAEQMDPQQRLLLELVWEALEDAGIPPSSLAGEEVGVFVGASAQDYGNSKLFDIAAGDQYFATGNTLSLISNRISYIYDLRGPSFTVDTACSSSLVALNEAVAAIRSGRIDTAIVAGVSLLVSPFSFISFSRASMLSPTGLCQAFDAKADGYVRAEGGVVLVLRALPNALGAANLIHGLVVGSGINQDGRTVGVAMPNRAAQAALLARVYHEGAIEPERLSFIECHGTGTRVGDPAEAFAIGEALAQKRSRPLPIGSIKTNLGHLEPASGLVGTLKAILALEHDLLPQSLHCVEPNPDIPFDELNLKIATSAAAAAACRGRPLCRHQLLRLRRNERPCRARRPAAPRTHAKGRRPGAAIPPFVGAQPCGSERACVALRRPARKRAAARRAGRRLGGRASPRHAAEPSCGDLENARRDCDGPTALCRERRRARSRRGIRRRAQRADGLHLFRQRQPVARHGPRRLSRQHDIRARVPRDR